MNHNTLKTKRKNILLDQSLHLLGEDGLHKLNVVNIAVARNVNSLEQLVYLAIAQLLAQRRQNVSKLTDTDISSLVLVKDLESANVVLWLAKRLESVGAVNDLGKGVKVEIARERALQLVDLAKCRVLANGTQQIAEGLRGNATSAALVEEGESVLVCFRILGLCVLARGFSD